MPSINVPHRASQRLVAGVAWHSFQARTRGGTRGMSMRLFTILMFLGAGSLVGSQALAQAPAQRGTGPAPTAQPAPAQQGPSMQQGPAPAQGAVANDSKIEGVATKDVANIDDPHSPFEKPDTTYRFIGARFRYIIVPKFYMGIFGDG